MFFGVGEKLGLIFQGAKIRKLLGRDHIMENYGIAQFVETQKYWRRIIMETHNYASLHRGCSVAVPSGGLKYCVCRPQYSRTSSVESVLLPFGHIVFNVIRDKIQLVHVSDEVLVVSGLPFKRESVLPCEFGDTDFEPAYHRCEIFRLGTKSVVWHNDVVSLSYFPIPLRLPML